MSGIITRVGWSRTAKQPNGKPDWNIAFGPGQAIPGRGGRRKRRRRFTARRNFDVCAGVAAAGLPVCFPEAVMRQLLADNPPGPGPGYRVRRRLAKRCRRLNLERKSEREERIREEDRQHWEEVAYFNPDPLAVLR